MRDEVALITGTGGGIGRALVDSFARRQEVKLIATSRSKESLDGLSSYIKNKYSRDLDCLQVDFGDEGFTTSLTKHIESAYGHLTYLVNNAGLLINKPFESMSNADMEAQMAVNYSAPFKLIRDLMPLLRRSEGHAHVVNIGSMGGFQGSGKFPGLSAYSASKGALAVLTECLASEYANQGIYFNCLALGSANTDMLREAFPDYTSKMEPERIADFITHFTLTGFEFFNGKVIPVAGVDT